MRLVRLFLLTLLVLVKANTFAQNLWTPLEGYGFVKINSLLYDTINQKTFVATDAGIYESDDFGTSFKLNNSGFNDNSSFSASTNTITNLWMTTLGAVASTSYKSLFLYKSDKWIPVLQNFKIYDIVALKSNIYFLGINNDSTNSNEYRKSIYSIKNFEQTPFLHFEFSIYNASVVLGKSGDQLVVSNDKIIFLYNGTQVDTITSTTYPFKVLNIAGTAANNIYAIADYKFQGALFDKTFLWYYDGQTWDTLNPTSPTRSFVPSIQFFVNGNFHVFGKEGTGSTLYRLAGNAPRPFWNWYNLSTINGNIPQDFMGICQANNESFFFFSQTSNFFSTNDIGINWIRRDEGIKSSIVNQFILHHDSLYIRTSCCARLTSVDRFSGNFSINSSPYSSTTHLLLKTTFKNHFIVQDYSPTIPGYFGLNYNIAGSNDWIRQEYVLPDKPADVIGEKGNTLILRSWFNFDENKYKYFSYNINNYELDYFDVPNEIEYDIIPYIFYESEEPYYFVLKEEKVDTIRYNYKPFLYYNISGSQDLMEYKIEPEVSEYETYWVMDRIRKADSTIFIVRITNLQNVSYRTIFMYWDSKSKQLLKYEDEVQGVITSFHYSNGIFYYLRAGEIFYSEDLSNWNQLSTSGLTEGTVILFFHPNNDTLWVGTYGNGIYFRNSPQIFPVTTSIAGRESLTLYPNPSNGSFRIVNNETDPIKTIQIMDVKGVEVLIEKHDNSNTYNLKLNKGLYIITATHKSGIRSHAKLDIL